MLEMWTIVVLLSTFALVNCFTCRSQSVTQIKPWNLNIIAFVPLPDDTFNPAFDQGYSIIPAIELAVDQINRRTDILPKRYFQLNVKDSGCDKAPKTAIETIRVLRDLLVTRHGPIAIIGPACSEDSIFVTNTFRRIFNLPVFYSGTTPYLSEHADDVPNAFGVISSTAVLTDTLIRIAVKENWNWTNIAVLYEDSRELFQHTYGTFLRQLNSSQQVGYTRQISASQIPLAQIIKRNIRIVVVFCGKEAARQLVCLAGQSEVDFTFPTHQIIFTEKSVEDFLGIAKFSFTQQSEGIVYHCDKDTMMRGSSGSVLINQALDSVDPNVHTISNYTVGEVKQQYKERLSECGKVLNTTLSETTHAYPYYDAIWALGLGMHIALSKRFPSFSAIHKAVKDDVSFQGLSSWINFRKSRQVSNNVIILQVANTTAIEKGQWNGSTLMYANETFINDEFRMESVSLHPALAAMGLVLAITLLIITLIIQALMTIYRKYPSIKASSIRLNQFIYLGSYLFIASVVANTVRLIAPNTNGTVLCNIDVLSSTLASSFIFGTLLAKTWRMYLIFNHIFSSRSHYSLHDATLATFILIINVIQGLMFVPVFVVTPFEEVISFVYDSTRRPPIKRQESVCTLQSAGYVAFPMIYLLSLVLATVFIATLNRKVKRKNFRTTKQIAVLVYTLAVMWAIGIPLLVIFYHLEFSVNITYSLYSFLIFATILLCHSLLILPYLLPVTFNRKKTTNTRQEASSSTNQQFSTQQSILSYRRLSSLMYMYYSRRSSVQSQSDCSSPVQIDTDRRSSLPPYVISVRSPRTRTMSLQSNISESPLSLPSISTSPQIASQIQVSPLTQCHTMLQSISE